MDGTPTILSGTMTLLNQVDVTYANNFAAKFLARTFQSTGTAMWI
jgi:hypothetical protein